MAGSANALEVGRRLEGDVAGTRHSWLDHSRGLVVLLVVLMHVGQYQYLPLTLGSGPAPVVWSGINDALNDVRMPALMVISGWLATRQILMGLGSAPTRRRVWTNVWLYVVWLVLYAAITVALGAGDVAQAVTPENLLEQLVLPYSTLWFLPALVWYTILLALLRRVPGPWVVLGAFAVSAAGSLLSIGLGTWVRLPQEFVFFTLGVHLRNLWERLALRPLPSILAGSVLVGLSLPLSNGLAEVGLWTYPASFVRGVGGVVILFAVAALATGSRVPMVRAVEWVGRRTISVYVLHFPVMMLLTVVAAGPLHDWPRAFIASPAGAWLYPIVTTIVIAAAAIATQEVATRVGLGALFSLPRLPHLSYRSKKEISLA